MLAALYSPATVSAQSTFGTIVGTVKDAASERPPRADVLLSNRALPQAGQPLPIHGELFVQQFGAGSLSIAVRSPGLRKSSIATLDLQARETKTRRRPTQSGTQTES